MKKFLLIFLSAIVFCFTAYKIYFWYLGVFVDNPVVYAQGNYPLGQKQVYIIELNKGEVDENGNSILEENMFYTFRKPDEDRQYPYLSGRHIGRTKVNLDEYLGKNVYIDGYFSMGLPTLLKDKDIPEYLVREDKVILNIEALTVVE
jgi:hypothetical protein